MKTANARHSPRLVAGVIALNLALALAGCDQLIKRAGGGEDAAAPADPVAGGDPARDRSAGPAMDSVAEVPVVDRFDLDPAIVDGESAFAAGFWSHPTLAFSSIVLAGGHDGLVGFVVESGAEAARIDGRVDALDVAYIGGAGYAFALDAGTATGIGRLRIISIDDIDQSFDISSALDNEAFSEGTGVCAAGDPDQPGATIAYVATARGAVFVEVGIADGVPAVSGVSAPVGAPAIDCAIDPATGEAFFLGTDMSVRRGPDGPALARLEAASAIGLILKRPEAPEDDADAPPATSTFLVALNRSSGRVQVLSGETGDILGEISLTASFDHAAVASGGALAAGFGNYGAVYRDGAIAVGSTGADGANVSVIPWNAVADRLGLPLSAGVAPRNLQPEEEDPFAVDISPTQP
ncbi:MAG: hypothetical protein GC152_15940 [Alphaproteobacteria bacterium]|nr:hypothetical protein [Alphaproteobacteria bacterium]